MFRELVARPKPEYADACLACEAKTGRIATDPKQHAKAHKPSAEDKRLAMIKRELASRELARRHLIPFIKRHKRNYQDGWLHRKIAAELEQFLDDVVNKREPRLMLFVPPRHGKSELASDFFPSWAMGKYPWIELIASSYAVQLPIKFSRRNKDRIQTKTFQAIFPETHLHPSSRSVEHWNTTDGGGYIAAGVGGGITGHGSHILLIDDPIKDAEEADSEQIRETLWDWWSATASTRVEPGGGVLIIQTRWHDADLSGKLLTQMKDALEEGDIPDEEIEKWRVISFPAIAEGDEYELPDGRILENLDEDERYRTKARLIRRKGEALHEDRWPLRYLKKKRRSMNTRHWSALYQQRPVPDEGANFSSDMFVARPRTSIPLSRYRLLAAFDLAIGEKVTNDWTVGVVGAVDEVGRLQMVDMIRGRWGTFRIVEAILDIYESYRPLRIGIEKGQLDLAIKDVLKMRMEERRLYPSFDQSLKPITDKERRASTLQGMMEHHRVLFPRDEDAPWMGKLREELMRFPHGQHDDIVDAMSWLARMAARMGPSQEQRRIERPKSWKDQLRAARRARDPMAA